MPSPAPPERPTLERLAEVLHATASLPGYDGPTPAELVSLRLEAPNADEPDGAVEMGRWIVPNHLGHPLAPLIGFRAPAAWDAVGLVSAAWMRHLDRPDAGRSPTATVLLWDRDDRCASAMGDPAGEPLVTRSPPEGLVADVARRMLGLATPPPQMSPRAAIDVTWLERLSTGLARRPGRPRSWAWAADRHPHRGYGPTPLPDVLAERTRTHERATWGELRARMRTAELPAATYGPPGGEVLTLGDWFDDGSLSRWLIGGQVDPGTLAAHVLDALGPAVAERVQRALVEVEPRLGAST